MSHKRLLLTAAFVALAAAVPIAAQGSTAGGVKIKVALPQPQSATVVEISVKASGKGPVKPITGNDKALGNLALLYVVAGPARPRAGAAYQVYVLMHRFSALRRLTRSTGDRVTVSFENVYGTAEVKPSGGRACFDLDRFNHFFESGSNQAHWLGETWTLSSGRSAAAQSSPPEEVLDDFVAAAAADAKCTNFTPEAFDNGNT